MVASGPPLYSPFKLLDPLVNTTEMFIHHEDVRRAAPGWQPRSLDGDLESALRRQVRFAVRLSLGRAPATVTVHDSDGTTLASVGKGPQCAITRYGARTAAFSVRPRCRAASNLVVTTTPLSRCERPAGRCRSQSAISNYTAALGIVGRSS